MHKIVVVAVGLSVAGLGGLRAQYQEPINTNPAVSDNSVQSNNPAFPTKKPMATLETIYGKVTFSDPLLIKLSTHQAFGRLQAVDVEGPSRYLRQMPNYSMFEHAFGVLALLIRFNRPLQEQTASLLSHVAHTAFGDFGSFMFDTPERDIFQLDTQGDFLVRTGLDKILRAYNFSNDKLNPMQNMYPAISKSPPDLSAQAIDQTLRMAIAYKMIDRDGISKLLDDLRFEKGDWFFTNPVSAEKFARLTLYFADNFWGSENTYLVNRWMGQALKRAMDMGRLSINDLRFGVDQNILKTLVSLKDPTIMTLLKMASNPIKYYKPVKDGPFEMSFQTPFKGLNPLVQRGGALVELSDIDLDFKEDYIRVRDKIAKGFRVNIIKGSPFQEKQSEGDFGFSPSQFEPYAEPTTFIELME